MHMAIAKNNWVLETCKVWMSCFTLNVNNFFFTYS